jgi:EAL domain-containing protein (putative c-di-GMP-specific phosphodiesterase class I)/PAS domain-containing protein
MPVLMLLRDWLRLRPVRVALNLLLTGALAALLAATIFWTHFNVMWLAFLGGVLFAAALAMATQMSRAQWLAARRSAQLDRMRTQLAQEAARSRNAAEAMRLAEARLRLVTDALPIPLLYLDSDGRCHYHNRALERLTGLTAERVKGRHLREFVGAATYQALAPHLEQAFAGKSGEFELTREEAGPWETAHSVRYFPYPPGEPRPHGCYLLLSRIPAAGPRTAVAANGAADEAAQLAAEGGEALYLRSIADELMGWDDPRAKLARALEDNQFLLYGQKILALKSGLRDPACFEILLRLQEEEDHLLPPGGFLPVAERYGMMEELDRWVVRNVIAWCLRQLRNSPGARLPLYCVNLSGASVRSPEFANYVLSQLTISSLAPRTLCLEIGEQDAINHHAAVERLIALLKPAGCLHTIDAFGSTKVSFTYLKGLPVDFLKIDGNIIQYILRDPSELAKARAINTVCQKIGVRTIAEFVETRETLDKLREIGVDYVQGFGVARPGPLDKLA